MDRFRWMALAAVAIPIAALFGPALAADRSFALRDAAHFYYPLFEWCAGEWAAGRVPLWNPLENAGTPSLADASSSVFYPGKLLFLLPGSFSLRYKLYVVLHVVLAAAGSYWLARAWRSSHFAAAIAAMSYACGGHVVFQYCNVVFLVGAAWLPFAALAADRMLRQRDGRAAVLLGTTLAMMVLGGDPQAAYHALLITGLYCFLGVRKDSPDLEAGKSGWLKTSAIRLKFTALAAAVGFLLAAVQMLPSAEATRYSERAAFDAPRNVYEIVHGIERSSPRAVSEGLFGTPAAGTHHRLAYDFSVGPWRLAEYFWPNVSGRMFPTHRRWLSLFPSEGRTWTPTLYLGLLPVLLALSCFRLRGGEARPRWLSWLVLLLTLACFGWYGIGWLAREVAWNVAGSELSVGPQVGGVYWLMATLLPAYVYFRYPAKLLPLIALGLCQLAAIGWDRAFAERRPRLGRMLQVFAIGSAVAALAVWLAGPFWPGGVKARDASLGPFDAAGAYRDVLWAFVQAALVAAGGWWLLRKAWSQPAAAPRWQSAAVLLTAVELAIANYWLVPTAPASLWRSEPAIAAAIQAAEAAGDGSESSVPPPRAFRGSLAGWRPQSFGETRSFERIAEIARWEHDTLFPKYHLASDLALTESYGSIKLMDYESLLYVARRHGFRQDGLPPLPQPTALRLLGTEHLVLPVRSEPPFAERMAGDEESLDWPENASLWRMKRTLPRAWIVHDVVTLPPLSFPREVRAVDDRTQQVLFPDLQARDFRRMAVVESNRSLPTMRGESSSEERCRIRRYEPQRVVVETELASPGLIVLSDAWYPGWKAFVTTDGGPPREAPIYRTNRVLRGVWLPAGRQTVDFRFQPTSFYCGAWISAASWLVVLIGGAFLVGRRRYHRTPSAS